MPGPRIRRSLLGTVLAFAAALACEAREAPSASGSGGPTAKGPSADPTAPAPADPAGPTPDAEPAPPPTSPAPESGELAFLAAAPDQDSILADARTEAEACDAGEADGCRRLANRYEEGLGAPRDRARALALYRRGCERGEGFHCLLGGWLQTATRDADEISQGLALLRRACELEHLAGCTAAAWLIERDQPGAREAAELRASACQAGYMHACVGDTRPSAAKTPVSAEAACPTSFYMTTSQSGGPRMHDQLDQLDHEAMLATIPEQVGTRTSERRHSTPAGWAGTRTSSASVELVAGESRVSVNLADRAPDCTLQPGTGQLMLAVGRAKHPDAREVSLGEQPALLLVGPDGASSPVTITAWIADRCTLSISGPLDDAVEVGAAIDLPALARLCARRPGADPLGLR